MASPILIFATHNFNSLNSINVMEGDKSMMCLSRSVKVLGGNLKNPENATRASDSGNDDGSIVYKPVKSLVLSIMMALVCDWAFSPMAHANDMSWFSSAEKFPMCSSEISAAVNLFYSRKIVRPFDSRNKIEIRLKNLVDLVMEVEWDGLPCRHRSEVPLIGFAGYGSGSVYLFLDGSGICVNEDDEIYDVESSDMDKYPWVERWKGALTDAPGRAIMFLPLCFTWDGQFKGYAR